MNVGAILNYCCLVGKILVKLLTINVTSTTDLYQNIRLK